MVAVFVFVFVVFVSLDVVVFLDVFLDVGGNVVLARVALVAVVGLFKLWNLGQ